MPCLDIQKGRATMLDVVKRVAEVRTVPFTVGGRTSEAASAVAVIQAGGNRYGLGGLK